MSEILVAYAVVVVTRLAAQKSERKLNSGTKTAHII